MTNPLPELTQFRVEPQTNGLVHLVFDCPGKSVNVFSNIAIHELGTFAEWLHRSDARGVVVRSGKATGFCAGADLTELGVAYDMIVAAPPADRFDMAFAHFFPLGHAIRRLETAGKPVAAAIHGVALGGGCELALGCHYRVATRSPRTLLGLPECAVGLLPGAGGTQRMPRQVGLDLGLEVLLLGRNLQGETAKTAGLVDLLVDEGDEIGAAVGRRALHPAVGPGGHRDPRPRRRRSGTGRASHARTAADAGSRARPDRDPRLHRTGPDPADRRRDPRGNVGVFRTDPATRAAQHDPHDVPGQAGL